MVELKQIHGKSFVNKFPPRVNREKEGPQETQKFSNFQALVSQRLLQSKFGHFRSLYCLWHCHLQEPADIPGNL